MRPDFETLLQIIRLAAEDYALELTKVVLASAEGDVWFVEVIDGGSFRSQLEMAYRRGGIALGLLGWELEGERMQAKSMLFPWHQEDKKICGLFKRLCELGVDSVKTELERRNVN